MTEFDKFGRRRKFQREIYTPGSGPLRKSGKEDTPPRDGVYRNIVDFKSGPSTDRAAEITRVTEKLKEISITNSNSGNESRNNDNSRRNRKPDCELYVPKPVAEAYASRQKERESKNYEKVESRHEAEFSKNSDSTQTNSKSDRRSQDRSGKRRDRKKKTRSCVIEDDNASSEEKSTSLQKYRSRESLYNEDKDYSRNRMLRQGSEPVVAPVTYAQDRLRDLRSIDTSMFAPEKNNSKPPLGRRGSLSKTGLKLPPTFDSLPPRLQKKYITENAIHDPHTSSVGTNVENSRWDGHSVVFQGKPGSHNGQQNVRNPPVDKVSRGFSEWSKTLPTPVRTKGRGRLNRENHAELYEPLRYSRSLTPEKLNDSRFENAPHELETSPNQGKLRTSEKENRVFRELSDPVQITSENKKEKMDNRSSVNDNFEETRKPVECSDSENVIDWAAEVERCEQQDTNPLSRCNSRESFAEPAPPPQKERRKRKKRHAAKDKNDRGKNCDDLNTNLIRRGSMDSISNYSRNNSIERNWRERSNNDCRSRKNSSCDNRSRQSSIDRRENFNNRYPRSRKNSSCDNRSRQSSTERRDRYFGNGRSRHGREEGGGGGGGGRRRGKSKDDRKIPRLLEETNWRLEQEIISREKEKTNINNSPNSSGKQAGILILPQPIMEGTTNVRNVQPPLLASHKKLFDPSNPDKPIVVSNMRQAQEDDQKFLCNGFYPELPMLINANMAEQMTSVKPIWYNPFTENFQASHNQQLIRAIEQADCELQYLLSTCELLKYWDRMQLIRVFLKDALKTLLLTDLRFCEVENVEQHLWKILYYNVIELLRKLMADHPESKESYRQALLNIIEEGSDYYEQLLNDLESANNNIKIEVFLNTPICMRENLKYNVLPLIAAQKIFLSLGDLTRYKEQANETCNYGLARQWYMKAHQINPKNGRPYNQLAILALYTKRKLDAVYYYMRCLMSSNPISAAKESLISLFDESRKKYEAVDKKRKEEKAKKEREKMKEKEGGGGIRREIWIHPGGRKNMHRTTSTCKADFDSEDEQLYSASNIEVNKRFVVSYLHVHGKIYTKIGLESLTETAVQMLKQFRALLHHSPIPLNSNRFLQLFALNMFAIEISQPKGDMMSNEGGCYRSATQESAIVISLQMFNLLLERFVQLLKEYISGSERAPTILPPDCLEILPALKVWCDWLMTHVEVWNPPPSCQDYKVGPPEDCWTRIATVVNLLEKIDYKGHLLTTENRPDHELVYLNEDATLSGFTPLMANIHEPIYRHKDTDMDLAQISLRIHKILFFGTVFLCGIDPPVLKLQKTETGESEYISVVDTESSQEQALLGDNETWSESEDSGKETGPEESEGEVLGLAARRRQLQQQASRRLSQMARITNALTEMEIRPHDLVPDTNCFIECLPELETILRVLPHPQHPYVLMVPLVVVNELEGLSRGCKPSQSVHHSALVRETAKAAMALFQKKHPALRTCTTRGTILSSTTFTHEEDTGVEMTNDDKILTTCVNLCKTSNKDEIKEGGRRKLYRDVVLLTEDRNLVLKAMGRDMPVRSLPDFIRWAGLG
ncbi:telomerase-binding protein EST1A isoform X2 [Halyomorpha halys]|uniref:telomerase-binding protein EST1A isoform X2 n=1 Tax=Halyomorpha halys TaxID=286706 RepID=UPI0006D4E8F9